MSIENLGYLVFGVADLEAWRHFASTVIGARVDTVDVDPRPSLVLRIDDHRQRMLLVQDPADDLLEAGWEFATSAELDAFIARLSHAGIDVRDGSPAQRAQRRVERLYLCEDPNGFQHGFYFGAERAMLDDPYVAAAGTGVGFETGRLGIGHFVAVAKDAARSVAFYRDSLQLRVSDLIREEIEPGRAVEITFFHTRTGRHHSIATAQSSNRKRISHFMLQYRCMDDVGLAYDRCVREAVPIVMGLGHHPNDRMFSFYAATPSGFAIELGHGGVVIDDARWTVATYPRRSDWGHELFPRGRPGA